MLRVSTAVWIRPLPRAFLLAPARGLSVKSSSEGAESPSHRSARRVSAVYVSQVLHLKELKKLLRIRAPVKSKVTHFLRVPRPLGEASSPDAEVFFFPSGAFVAWNTTAEEDRKLLALLKSDKHATHSAEAAGPLTSSPLLLHHGIETDEYTWSEAPISSSSSSSPSDATLTASSAPTSSPATTSAAPSKRRRERAMEEEEEDESSASEAEEEDQLVENDHLIVRSPELRVPISFALSSCVMLNVLEGATARSFDAVSAFLTAPVKGVAAWLVQRWPQKLLGLLPEPFRVDKDKVLAERNVYPHRTLLLLIVKKRLELASTPEYFWEQPRLLHVYDTLSRYLELTVRWRALGENLDYCQGLVTTLLDDLKHQHSIKLERIIIYLILVEVVYGTIDHWDKFKAGLLGTKVIA